MRWEVVTVAEQRVDNHINGPVSGNVVQARDIGVVNIGQDTAELDLDDYLLAVLRAAEDHPVASRRGLSAAAVPLSEVYVDQHLRHGPHWTRSTWRAALAANSNVILVGAPGGGKSSLLRRIAHTLADEQLHADAPDCLPVRVPASAFRSGVPLSEAIREGTLATLGSFLLRKLPEDVFAKPAPGGRPWLVLVDGLDEVVGISEAQTALQAVTEGARHPFLRFLLATRPLRESDLDAAGNTFPVYRLQPFDLPTLDRFATRWFTRNGLPDSAESSERLVDHVRRNEIRDWAVQPLAATMLCELLVLDPHRRLPERVTDLYDQYVHKLFTGRSHTKAERTFNRDLVLLLEDVAGDHVFRDPGVSVLDHALRHVRGTALEPQSADPAVRRREVHDMLCRTGLVVPDASGVRFAHATLEEYFVARLIARKLAGRNDRQQEETISMVINALPVRGPGFTYYGEAAEHFSASQLPVFLIDLWIARGKDADALLARMVRSAPHQSRRLVRRLTTAGTPIGPKATAEVTAVAVNHLNEVEAALTLRDLGHPDGLARLLAMAVDPEFSDEGWTTVVDAALESGPAAVSALTFLLKHDETLEGWFPHDVLDENDDADPEGLALVVENQYLAENVRAHAGALAFSVEGEPAYRRLLAQRFSTDLTTLLGDEAARGLSEARSLLWHMVADPDLASRHRWDAAAELSLVDERSGEAALRMLAADPRVDARHRH
jgi:hypothetical protein